MKNLKKCYALLALLLCFILIASSLSFGRLSFQGDVPKEFASLYTFLDGKLNGFLNKLDKDWDKSTHPVFFSANLITANPNSGEKLLAPGAYEVNLKYLDALQNLGVKGIGLDINFPLLDPKFHNDNDKFNAYLNFYTNIVNEIKQREMVVSIEVQPIFPDYSTLPVKSYFKSLTLEEYKKRVSEMVKLIAFKMKPEYLILSNEPDTAAYNTGFPLDNLNIQVENINYFLKELKNSGITGIKYGAGFGTWQKDYLLWTTAYAQKTTLDFIDIHIYAIGNDFLDRAITISDIAKNSGKSVGVHEAWLHKMGENEKEGVATSKEIFSRDVYSFWAPLDQKFLTALVNLSHSKKFEYISPFWSNFFFSYLDYEAAKNLTQEERYAYGISAGIQAAKAGKITQTGEHYKKLISSGEASGEDIKIYKNLEYANINGKPLLLDLYVPLKLSNPAPLIIWVHGGGWQAGSKENPFPIRAGFTKKGYAVASINYRLSGEAIFPAQIEDCKAAVRWLRANALKYNLDAEHFGAWGSSAGGHLVALLGTSGGVLEFDKGESLNVKSDVQAVCDYFGPTDLVKLVTTPGYESRALPSSPESKLLGGPVLERKELAAKANPITYIDKDDPPFLIVHGDKDPVVPLNQSEILYEALINTGVSAALNIIKDAKHGGPEFSTPQTLDMIVKFFDRFLKSDLKTLTPPILISPSDNEKLISLSPTFVWNKIAGSEDPIAYTLEVSKTKDFKNIIFKKEDIAQTQLKLQDGILEKGHKYFWRVKGKADLKESNWSSTYSFYTITKIVLQINNPYMEVDLKIKEIDPGKGTVPIIYKGRAFVPIRAIIEALSGSVSWDEANKKVTIILSNNKIEFTVGSNIAIVNGEAKEIEPESKEIVPFIHNNRVMLPLRFIAENLGAEVIWDSNTQKITIIYPIFEDIEAKDIKGSVIHDGLKRTYIAHIPPLYSKSQKIPVVFALHGGGGSGEGMVKLTQGGFNTLADKEGFIVVYPDGFENHWNDGRSGKETGYRTHIENIDDVGFISELIEHFAKTFNIDRARVYVTGISNGGLMSFRLAHELSNKIAAIATVAIQMTDKIALMQKPSRPISVLMICGTKDPLVPWEGGYLSAKRGKVMSVEDTVKYWIEHNKCNPAPQINYEPDKDPDDGTRVKKEVYSGGKEGTEVILYTVEGGGHTWPSGFQYLSEFLIGKTSKDIDANEVIWNFFKKHSLSFVP